MKVRISGSGLRHVEVQTRDCRHVSCQACCLVRVSVGRSDSRHETDSPFLAIPKVSRIFDVLAVLMMSINKRINEAHHHDPILEASQEHLGDQVMGRWLLRGSTVACHPIDKNILYRRRHSL